MNIDDIYKGYISYWINQLQLTPDQYIDLFDPAQDSLQLWLIARYFFICDTLRKLFKINPLDVENVKHAYKQAFATFKKYNITPPIKQYDLINDKMKITNLMHQQQGYLGIFRKYNIINSPDAPKYENAYLPDLPNDIHFEILMNSDIDTVKKYCHTQKDIPLCSDLSFWESKMIKENVKLLFPLHTTDEWIKWWTAYSEAKIINEVHLTEVGHLPSLDNVMDDKYDLQIIIKPYLHDENLANVLTLLLSSYNESSVTEIVNVYISRIEVIYTIDYIVILKIKTLSVNIPYEFMISMDDFIMLMSALLYYKPHLTIESNDTAGKNYSYRIEQLKGRRDNYKNKKSKFYNQMSERIRLIESLS